MKKSAELGDEREVKLEGISGSESVFYKTVSGQHGNGIYSMKIVDFCSWN